MRRFRYENGLSIVFGLLFLGALVGQSIAGHADFNNEAISHHQDTISYLHYLTTSSFGQAVLENWQSEYLQFLLYIWLTVYLLQRGSPESKELGDEGRESDEEQKVAGHADARSPRWARVGGVRTFVYSHSLLLLMGSIFVASWVGQSFTGWSDYNSQQLEHGDVAVTWWGYVTSASFWQSTLQNWQSEFLAVGSMAIFSVYLRARGSSESKPVGAPHDATSVSG